MSTSLLDLAFNFSYQQASDYTRLPVVDNYDYLKRIRVPEGVFSNNRTVCANEERLPSPSDQDDSSARGSHSPVSPSFELKSPWPSPNYYRAVEPDPAVVLPPPVLHSREGRPRVSLPTLSSLGYIPPRPALLHRHSAASSSGPTYKLSPEDRRILDKFRVVI